MIEMPNKSAVGSLNNTFVSIATNVRKTHPIQAQFANKVGNPHAVYLHAEIACIVKARQELDTIYVARVNRSNDLSLAKPCPICMMAMGEHGIKQVWYTIANNNYGLIEF